MSENPTPILHLDMDAFFAAIEQRDNPHLRGKPVLIGHDGPRGVVATASYEARPFGCHSAQPMITAKRLCPHAIVVPVRHERYREVSRHMFAILDEFSPTIEPLSIDEAFLDLTGTEKLLGSSADVAAQLRARIQADLHLTASVGVAPNKYLAKLASDMHKPDALTIIRPEDIETILPPLPVTKLWGIGKATAAGLERFGIHTIGDLRNYPLEWLQQHLGSDAQRYFHLARGIDTRRVVPDREAKSISHEQTFDNNIADPEEIRRTLLDQVEQVAWRLRRHHVFARGISLKIRHGEFQTISRSATLPSPTDTTSTLFEAALDLFNKWPFEPVRLIGFSADRLGQADAQPSLFADPVNERQKKLDSVADRINTKFGKRAIRRGGAI